MPFFLVRRKILRLYFVGAEVLPEQVNTPPTLLFCLIIVSSTLLLIVAVML
jgi:hypothetical protein